MVLHYCKYSKHMVSKEQERGRFTAAGNSSTKAFAWSTKVRKHLTASRLLKSWLAQDFERNRFNIAWGGPVGLIAHPLYYLFCVFALHGFYDSAFLRLSSAALALPLLFQSRATEAQKPWLNLYWYAWLIYVLPVTFTYILLANHLTPMWLICETMMIFITMILTGSFSLVLMILGIGIPIACVSFVVTTGQALPWSYELFTYFVPLPMVICSGVIFTASTKKSAALYEKNKAIQALSGSIAHEMRNPLSQIKASLDGIEKNLPLPNHELSKTMSQQKIKNLYEYVSAGGSAIKRGLQVIAMILDEVKDKPINPQTLNYLHAAQATQKAIAEYGYETDGERDKVTLEVKRNFIFKGDETLYLFVLFNLIKNALYYFKLSPQSTITITVDHRRITVKDTGPGIPKERISTLFDSFQTSGKQGGTGLGLAYCKRVMQAFGGDIRCQSVVGEYTEFILEFPEVSAETWQQYQNSIAERIHPLLSGKKILVVDDDETVRLATQAILRNLNVEVDLAENGQQALDLLTQSSYDVLILDLNMPVLDGYATAEQIRSGIIPSIKHIPIMAYTTEVAYMAKVKTQKVGINAFVSKPCEPLVLLQTLENILTQTATPQTKENLNSLAGKTIIVADDSEVSRALLKLALREKGIYVLEASHGQDVLEQLSLFGSTCDAILMDLHMPGIDGLETTRRIRQQNQPYSTVPIIAVTGDTDEDKIRFAYSAGIDDAITKPIELDSLLEKLVALCQKKEVPAPHPPSLFDSERLDFFKRTGIFKSAEDNSFVRQTQEWLTKLEHGVHNQDLKTTQDALHFLKGNSYTVGANAFANLMKEIEITITKGHWPLESKWLEEIKSLYSQTLSALRVHFGS